MADTTTYKGSCHCGKVRYEVDLALGEAMQCNCSICSRAGYLLAFAPSEHMRLLSGESELTDYQFGKHAVHHLFCRTCGVRSFGRGKGPGGKEMVAINLRCLEDVDANALPVKKVDGRSLLAHAVSARQTGVRRVRRLARRPRRAGRSGSCARATAP